MVTGGSTLGSCAAADLKAAIRSLGLPNPGDRWECRYSDAASPLAGLPT